MANANSKIGGVKWTMLKIDGVAVKAPPFFNGIFQIYPVKKAEEVPMMQK